MFIVKGASLVRPKCGGEYSRVAKPVIPHGGVPFPCYAGRRCSYDCDFMYSKNSSVPDLAGTYIDKWIRFKNLKEFYEEMEVDFNLLCICKYTSLSNFHYTAGISYDVASDIQTQQRYT